MRDDCITNQSRANDSATKHMDNICAVLLFLCAFICFDYGNRIFTTIDNNYNTGTIIGTRYDNNRKTNSLVANCNGPLGKVARQ